MFESGSHEASAALYAIQCATVDIAAQKTAPHVLMRPSLERDGEMWSALYGSNIQEGVAGFGATPAEACADFDRNWREQRAVPLAGVTPEGSNGQ